MFDNFDYAEGPLCTWLCVEGIGFIVFYMCNIDNTHPTSCSLSHEYYTLIRGLAVNNTSWVIAGKTHSLQ